jgi:hypothetical protein
VFLNVYPAFFFVVDAYLAYFLVAGASIYLAFYAVVICAVYGI